MGVENWLQTSWLPFSVCTEVCVLKRETGLVSSLASKKLIVAALPSSKKNLSKLENHQLFFSLTERRVTGQIVVPMIKGSEGATAEMQEHKPV
jgi:hypothetical protein